MLTIQFFGEVADKTGCTKESLDINEISLNKLLQKIQEKHGLEMAAIQVAVNHELVDVTSETILSNKDEIAILSPFAGG